MRAIVLRRIVNSTVWTASGIVVLIVRSSVPQGGSILVWEIIGGGMIIYGVGRLVWTVIGTLARGAMSV
jgi:hypothetical protein